MKVQEIMKKQVYSIDPNSTLKEAVSLLIKYNVSGLVVIDDKKIIGIVSEKDIYRAFYPNYDEFYQSPEYFTDFEEREEEIVDKFFLKVNEIMSKNIIFIGPEEKVMKAGAIMLAKNIHRLPVIDNSGKLVGIVSRRDIYLKLLKDKLNVCK